ncbi:MAG: helix-turn-helix transcriptional regulator [Phycisphaerales bacterium]
MDELSSRKTDVAVINVREVAEILGVNVRTIWRLSQRGDIPAPIRLGSRILRWRLTDLREHLDRKAGGGVAMSRATSAVRGGRR